MNCPWLFEEWFKLGWACSSELKLKTERPTYKQGIAADIVTTSAKLVKRLASFGEVNGSLYKFLWVQWRQTCSNLRAVASSKDEVASTKIECKGLLQSEKGKILLICCQTAECIENDICCRGQSSMSLISRKNLGA